MIRSLYRVLIAGAALGVAIPVFATPCYAIIDRSDVVIFRNTNTPVDLSSTGAPAREAMRSRGELLVFFEAGRLPVRAQDDVALEVLARPGLEVGLEGGEVESAVGVERGDDGRKDAPQRAHGQVRRRGSSWPGPRPPCPSASRRAG